MSSRLHYQHELDQLEAQALGGLELVARALERALETVEQRDVELAALVISDDDRIDGRYLEVHQSILAMLALQQPVASDLRLLAALLHVIRYVERMGDQCVNIAKLVPLAVDEPPADNCLLKLIGEMGAQARSQTVQARQAFERRDVGLARGLVRQDDEIDRLNREVFRLALAIGDDADRREWAMQMILAARYLERIGDNAVDIVEQAAFVVTGLFREFEDASHPDLSGDGG